MEKSSKNYDRFPPRVFVLIPEENDNAVVIRRGPSAEVGVFRWNLESDRIQGYQWLKGRIYEYFSDVSADGKYFIYSANKKGRGYTAISYSPWIKAISYWDNVGGRGGGVFFGNNKYMLYDGNDYFSKYMCIDLVSVKRNNKLMRCYSRYRGHGVYHQRLLRRGWTIKSYESDMTVFSKDIDKNTRLEKVWTQSVSNKPEGRGSFWEYHKLVSGRMAVDKKDWRWCEWLNDSLVWIEKGCLYRSTLNKEYLTTVKTLIYDFNPERFSEETAPY